MKTQHYPSLSVLLTDVFDVLRAKIFYFTFKLIADVFLMFAF